MNSTLTIQHDYEGRHHRRWYLQEQPRPPRIESTQLVDLVARYAAAWMLRSSRHAKPKRHKIAEVTSLLTELGYSVQHDIDEAMPSVAEQETDQAARMDHREQRLTQRAETMAARAGATRQKAHNVFDNIPPGQPLLVDHHSYAADRRRRERAWNNLGKALEQAGYAERLAQRANTAAKHTGARNNPTTVANRIERMQAEQHRLQRELDGKPRQQRSDYRQGEIATLAEHIEYWQRIYVQLQTDGKASTLGPDSVHPGDWVLFRGDWMRVRRVNNKSVSVPNPAFPAAGPGEREHTQTLAWHKLSGHRCTEQMPDDYVEAYEKPRVQRVVGRRTNRN